MPSRLASCCALALSVVACGSDGDDGVDPPPDACAPLTASGPSTLARAYGEVVPSCATGGPMPLVVLVHGYSASGAVQAAYFGIGNIVDEGGFLLATPDGTIDGIGNRFWNATDACCDFDGMMVDDVAYLTSVIDDMAARYPVDPDRVFLVGHSNGGFMSNRMACDVAGRIAGIASLAGATWSDPALCTPSQPVNVLLIHGDMDDTIAYGGGTIGSATYPGARDTAAAWATENGCSGALTAGGAIDIEANLAGDETTVETVAGCPAGGAVELWSIAGGGHIPALQSTFAMQVWDWLAAHAR